MKYLLLLLVLFYSLTATSQSPIFAARENGKKFGYINDRGEYLIQPQFDDAGAFYDDIAVVLVKKKFGVINRTGNFVVPAIYDDAILHAPDGFITVKKKDKWGIIDKTGKTVVPFAYSYISVMRSGYAIAGDISKNKKRSVFLTFHPVVLDQKGDTVYYSEEDPDFTLPGGVNPIGFYEYGGWPMIQENKVILAHAENEASYAVLDVKSKQITELPESVFPDRFMRFKEGVLALTLRDGPDVFLGGIYVDSAAVRTGNITTESAFDLSADKVHTFFNGVAAIEKDGKWAFIDRTGKIISQTSLSTQEYYAAPPMYYNGLIGLFKGNKAGFVNLKGETIIPFEFDLYHPFEWDVTPLSIKGQFGLMRKDGTWAVPPRFREIDSAPCPCYY